MLLQRKVDRAMKWSKERSLRAEGIDPEEEEIQAELRKHSSQKEKLPSMAELMEEKKQKELEHLEKGDVKAMILAAMITIFPICLALIGLICLIAYFFMIH